MINLDYITDRLNSIETQSNLHGFEFERFPAIDANI